MFAIHRNQEPVILAHAENGFPSRAEARAVLKATLDELERNLRSSIVLRRLSKEAVEKVIADARDGWHIEEVEAPTPAYQHPENPPPIPVEIEGSTTPATATTDLLPAPIHEEQLALIPPHPEDEKDRNDKEVILSAIDEHLATETDPDKLDHFARDLHEAELFPSARDALAKKAAIIRTARETHAATLEAEASETPDTLKG